MKILSIDFDIVMEPSINIYNYRPGGITWDKDPYLNILKINYDMYNMLTNYIMDLCDRLDIKNIHIISSHDKILSYCPKDIDFTLINIDHHHDIHYNTQNESEVSLLSFEQVNEGNWMHYLLTNENYKLIKYHWLNNANSEYFEHPEQYNNIQVQTLSSVAYVHLPRDIDTLVLCLSPNFVPPYIRSLFLLWLDIINKHYNAHIDFEDVQ